ncbi:unnamed protein product, partial [Eretmochelys imbricata]
MIHVSGRAVNCSAVASSWEPNVLLSQPEKLTLTLIISKVSLNYCLREKPALMEYAEVVCKQLGCGSAVSAPGNAHFGEGSGQTWLILVDCGGDQSALWDCSDAGWGAFSCHHSRDTGVICL